MFNVIFFTEDTENSNILRETDYNFATLKNGENMFYNTNIESFNSDLSALTNGKKMFTYCFNLSSFISDLSSLTDGSNMFEYNSNLTTFKSDLSSLTDGSEMFSTCTNLTTLDLKNLNSLTDAYGMFTQCTNLTTFKYNLSSLTNGYSMFSTCTNLTTFTSDLSSLTNSSWMFYNCSALTTFTSDLSSLENGSYMFYNCSALTTFTSDLSSLTNGYYMFNACSNLTSFTSDLSSLTDGTRMFYKCKLDAKSVRYIVQSLPTRPSNTTLTLGINVSSSTVDGKNTQQQLLEFANEVGYDTWAKLKQAFVDKKWTVTFQYGGTTSSITYDLREGITPQEELPIYVKVTEFTGDKNKSAMYCSSDGSKLYDLDWGHDVTNPEQYEVFSCLEEAYGYYDVIPKEFLEVIEEEQEQLEEEQPSLF